MGAFDDIATDYSNAGAPSGHENFFRLYEPTFGAEFRRAYRRATGTSADSGIALDPGTLYRALFLPGEVADAADTVRASFRQLANATEQAETILRRTWMIMATNFIDYRLKQGGSAGDVSELQDMIETYSALLTEVCRDLSHSMALEVPEADIGTNYYRKTIGGFRHYLCDSFDQELRATLCVFTCFRGIPVDSPAQVVAVSDEGVTFRVSQTQIAVLSRTGLALVESPVHGTAFRAYSSKVNVSACEVTFSHFIRHDQPLDRRRQRRIRSQFRLPVTIRKALHEFTGWLCDVSVTSSAVQLSGGDLSRLSEGDAVEVEFALPGTAGRVDIALNLPGRVRFIHFKEAHDSRAIRVVIQMPGSAKLFSSVSEYLAAR